jgi:hypothetical protein
MPEKEFSIEFMYKGSEYFGFVRPSIADRQTVYSVNLETEDNAGNLILILKPAHSDLHEFEFECVDGSKPQELYDSELLEEIGDQVANSLFRSSLTHLRAR